MPERCTSPTASRDLDHVLQRVSQHVLVVPGTTLLRCAAREIRSAVPPCPLAVTISATPSPFADLIRRAAST